MNIHLKTALSNIRRSPFQGLSAVFVLSITFFVVTTLSLLVYSSGKVLKYFETRPQVIAFLKDSAKPEEVTFLQKRLAEDIQVKDVKYVSKEEALAIYKEATSDNPLLSELVSPSIFPASIEFSLTNLNYASGLIEEVKKEPIVDQVGFTANIGGESKVESSVEKLKAITFYLRVGGGILVALLLTTSIVVLLVIISMRLLVRRQEVEVLDLIGATSAFVRSPVILEAVIYCLVGVSLGWIMSLIMTLYLTPAVVSYFKEIPVLPKGALDLLSLYGIILAIEVIIGLLLAVSGSMLAVSRSKKSK